MRRALPLRRKTRRAPGNAQARAGTSKAREPSAHAAPLLHGVRLLPPPSLSPLLPLDARVPAHARAQLRLAAHLLLPVRVLRLPRACAVRRAPRSLDLLPLLVWPAHFVPLWDVCQFNITPVLGEF